MPRDDFELSSFSNNSHDSFEDVASHSSRARQNAAHARQGGAARRPASRGAGANGPAPGPARKGGKKPPRDHVRIFVNTICSITIVFSVLVLGVISLLGSKPFDQGGIPDDVVITESADQTNLLIMGYDLSEDLTDVLMVLTMDLKNNKASVLQIPRDTYVDHKSGRYVHSSKINAAYLNAKEGNSKFGAIMSTVSNDFRIPLDGYIAFTIDGFRKLVTAVDGVPVHIPKQITMQVWEGGYDKHYKLGPGDVVLNSRTAEGFMRNRTFAMGDLDRAYMQRIFYASLLQKMLGMSTGDIAGLAVDCYKDVSTNLTLGQLQAYSSKMKDFSMDSISIFTLPGQFVETHTTNTGAPISLYSIHVDDYVELYNAHIRHYDAAITEDDVNVREIFKNKEKYSDKYDGGTFTEILDKYNATGKK